MKEEMNSQVQQNKHMAQKRKEQEAFETKTEKEMNR
jgi:hypothetical protein